MAHIIGGIAASHTPTIGFAYDKKKQGDPVWAPIFENFAPLAAWLRIPEHAQCARGLVLGRRQGGRESRLGSKVDAAKVEPIAGESGARE